MAKEDKGRVKLTVIQFETESSNETLQENIRSIANTIARSLAQPAPRASANVPPQLSAAEESADIVNEEETDVEVVTTSPTAKPKSNRRYPTPNIIDDIEFTSGELPLKDFMERKHVPSTDTKRYLAIAYWLKEYRNVSEITVDHIYTAYRFLGWKVPKNVAKPLSNLQHGNKWLGKGATKGSYVVNHIGENIINEMGNE